MTPIISRAACSPGALALAPEICLRACLKIMIASLSRTTPWPAPYRATAFSVTLILLTVRLTVYSTPLDGATRTSSPRRAAATVGCAVSPGNFGQAEPKCSDLVDGFQCCSLKDWSEW